MNIRKKAVAITKNALKRSNVTVSNSEFEALTFHVQTRFMDRENYPNSKNLRIARRFNSRELDNYFKQAEFDLKDAPSYYESTVYSRDGSFYFGFNYR